MADKKPAAAPVKQKGVSFAVMVAAIFVAIIAVMLMSFTIILVVGMIPTIVAYFVDTSKQRTLGPTVFYLNFAGVLPILMKLWKQGPNVNNAVELLMDPFMLLMMLAPAGFAWMLFMFVPQLVSGILRKRSELRIQTLEEDQKKLVEQWGPEVMGLALKASKHEEPKQLEQRMTEESFTA